MVKLKKTKTLLAGSVLAALMLSGCGPQVPASVPPTPNPHQTNDPLDGRMVPPGVYRTDPKVQLIAADVEHMWGHQVGPYGNGLTQWDVSESKDDTRILNIYVHREKTGNEVADYLVDNADKYDIYLLAWNGMVWRDTYPGNGWRDMADIDIPIDPAHDRVHLHVGPE